jgi:protein phosphatase
VTTIDVPAHAVVIAVGGKRDPIAEVLDLVPAVASPWQVDRPEEAAENLRVLLKEHDRVRVAMPRAHGKGIMDAANIARRHGAVSILLRLPGGPDDKALAKGLPKVDRVIALSDASDLAFRIVPMPADRSDLEGPFDIIGDIHGVADELRELLTRLGHMDAEGNVQRHPDGRIPVLLGDLTDRGPKNREAVEIARRLTELGGVVVLGNHDEKLRRWLSGKDVRVAAGLAMTIEELERDTTPEWRADMAEWLGSLPTHLVLDGGRLVVAHAGLEEALHGRMTPGAISFALYGKPVDGGSVLDEHGYPLAVDWAETYAGAAMVVHGHVVHPEPRVLNGVYAIDQGAVFGGSLTALRYPEREFVQVKAYRTYFEPHGRAMTAD